MTRGLIAWALMLTGCIEILADIVRLNITGLALLGVVDIAVALWLLDVFTREFWNRNHRRPLVATITDDHLERAHLQDQDHGTDIQR